MTNNIKFKTMNFPAKVETYDNGTLSGTQIVLTEDAETFETYATTTREVRIIDLPADAPEVLAEIERRAPKQDAQADEPADEGDSEVQAES